MDNLINGTRIRYFKNLEHRIHGQWLQLWYVTGMVVCAYEYIKEGS